MFAAVRSNRFRIAMLMTLAPPSPAPGHLPKCKVRHILASCHEWGLPHSPVASWPSRELPKWKRLSLGLLVLSKRKTDRQLQSVHLLILLPDMLPYDAL